MPLAFTEGFSPRPKMHFGPALPTCYASTSEYLDVNFQEGALTPCGLEGLARTLTEMLPEGMEVLRAVETDPRARSLMSAVELVEYVVPLRTAPSALDAALQRFLDRCAIPLTITRKGREKTVDLRSGVLALRSFCLDGPLPARVVAADFQEWREFPLLWMQLATMPRTARPTEVLDVLNEESEREVCEAWLCHRTAQLFSSETGREEPLPRRANTIALPDEDLWDGTGAKEVCYREEFVDENMKKSLLSKTVKGY